jgi:hypothetical protein
MEAFRLAVIKVELPIGTEEYREKTLWPRFKLIDFWARSGIAD